MTKEEMKIELERLDKIVEEKWNKFSEMEETRCVGYTMKEYRKVYQEYLDAYTAADVLSAKLYEDEDEE